MHRLNEKQQNDEAGRANEHTLTRTHTRSPLPLLFSFVGAATAVNLFYCIVVYSSFSLSSFVSFFLLLLLFLLSSRFIYLAFDVNFLV